MTATADAGTFVGAPISENFHNASKYIHVYKIWCFYQKVNNFLYVAPLVDFYKHVHLLEVRMRPLVLYNVAAIFLFDSWMMYNYIQPSHLYKRLIAILGTPVNVRKRASFLSVTIIVSRNLRILCPQRETCNMAFFDPKHAHAHTLQQHALHWGYIRRCI